ncbi:hypothetical protein [Microvirga sp. VF16]|uniref:hypothetical protein n=1 Tax=Microvirga sp. VF16 TaxID=2807101 RepID=UPI00193D6E1E|nr:hypothetical protein [Microvirga sp. VF16]QRM29046.1 hypothetical protein JO965_23140 [Microvirga sp. VF16]
MRTARVRLSADASMGELITVVSEGHPDSVDILFLVFQHATFPAAVLLDLDDMNMRGKQIWLAFHQVCDGRITHFILRVTCRDVALVSTVNALTLGEHEQAVCHGGSEQHLGQKFSFRSSRQLNQNPGRSETGEHKNPWGSHQ